MARVFIKLFGCTCVLAVGLIWLLWFYLPKWAPQFTYDHVPFLAMKFNAVPELPGISERDFFERYGDDAFAILKARVMGAENIDESFKLLNASRSFVNQHDDEFERYLLNLILTERKRFLMDGAIQTLIHQGQESVDSLHRLIQSKDPIIIDDLSVRIYNDFNNNHGTLEKYYHLYDEGVFQVFWELIRYYDDRDEQQLRASLALAMLDVAMHFKAKGLFKGSCFEHQRELLLKHAALDMDEESDMDAASAANGVLFIYYFDAYIALLKKYGLNEALALPLVHLRESHFSISEAETEILYNTLRACEHELTTFTTDLCMEINDFPESATRSAIKVFNQMPEPWDGAHDIARRYLTRAGPRARQFVNTITFTESNARERYIIGIINADPMYLFEYLKDFPADTKLGDYSSIAGAIIYAIHALPVEHQKTLMPVIDRLDDGSLDGWLRSAVSDIRVSVDSN